MVKNKFMNVLSCVSSSLLSISADGMEYSVEPLGYSFILYIDGLLVDQLFFTSRILATSITAGYISVVFGDGVHLYPLRRENRVGKARKIKIEGVVKAQALEEYLMLTVARGGAVENILYNVESAIERVIGRAENGHSFAVPTFTINRAKSKDDRILVLKYADHTRCIEEKDAELVDSSVSDIEDAKTVCKHVLFIDKRNILKISSNKIVHEKISTHRELLSISDAAVCVTGEGAEIAASKNKYKVSRYNNKYVLYNVTENSSNNILNRRMDNSHITNDKTDSSDKRTVKDHAYGHVIEQTDCMPALLLGAQSVSTFSFDKYVHQLLITGMIKIFAADKGTLKYCRMVGPVTTSGLSSFYAFSTHLATLVVLVYGSRCIVAEFGHLVSPVSAVSFQDTIKSVRKYRKEILVECSSGYRRYSLDKNRKLAEVRIPMLPNTTICSLDAPNPNVQHAPVTFTKLDNGLTAVQWNGKTLVEDKMINDFHLLHTGYVYTQGFLLVLSSGSISFPFCIKTISVYNSADRSTVLVQLVTGAVHLLSIANGAVEGRMDLFHSIIPEKIVMVSLASFLTVSDNVLTLFGGCEYIQPTIRAVLPASIQDAIITQEYILIVTEDSRLYTIDRTAQSTGVSRDDSVNALWQSL
ncbi:hypothetical protein NEMIN01_1623 [Nematocida minor]|uniref:uncharacterized protein n=1 Tax=Nematocida minor TaxID=1912983 RepID=UPI00221FF090|nr:uncharacterized protein NEMIN01_1623 [Nematocida minor]KAI5191690.1 hypothetical protein NEMIN01_1623 [Nematocida minor]